MIANKSIKTTTITPPESFTNAPLTPPATEDRTEKSALSVVLEEIRLRAQGKHVSTQPWQRFKLDPNSYKILQQKLRKDSFLWGFVEDKLRYHYFPSCHLFVLRMPPSLLHEKFLFDVTHHIEHWLQSIAQSQGPSGLFALNTGGIGSPKITFEESDYGSHQPDAAFKHLDEAYPGVVIEISYSQKKKDLPRLADDYILGSDQSIRSVIGIDIEYKASKQATVSIWRPQIIQNDAGESELCSIQSVVDQVFRDAEGTFVENPKADINIPLVDFATERLTTTFGSLKETIHISSWMLYKFLEKAETVMSKFDRAMEIRRTEATSTSKPWTRKRLRDLTPPEQLSSDREQSFVDREERAAKRAAKDDSSWKASSSPGMDSE